MQERLQGILNRIKEWWSKFTTKQKALLISIVTVVVMAIVVLAFIMTRPKMVTLINCESTKEAGTVKDLLEGESIAYEVSKDGLTFSAILRRTVCRSSFKFVKCRECNGITFDAGG